MLKKIAALAAFFAFFPVLAGISAGQEIKNPEAVSYLHAEVIRSGSVYLFDNSPFQSARDLVVTLSVPQNASRQRSFIKSMEGADRYYVSEDAWGNKIVKLYWSTPQLKKRLYYNLVSDVEVFDGEEAPSSLNMPETEMTKPNQEIAKIAFDATYGLDDIQRFFSLTDWVYYNMKYDNAAKSFTESAKWAYANRKGACDEFSHLLISMLRAVGYSPRYVVGFAYSENWGQHGWVEIDHQGKAISLDPTWLESPADSTHIKVAELPDSNLTETVEVKGGQITIDWNKDEPEVRVISEQERPKIGISASLVPENSSSESYSLLSTEFTSAGCILTNVHVKSCTMTSGAGFLSLSRNSQTLAFCKSQKAYWFLKSPEVERNMAYTCPVIIYGGGAEETVSVNIASDTRSSLSTRVSSQNVFTPGQIFEVETVTANSGHRTEAATLYSFFGGSVQSKDFELRPGDEATIKWTLKAPSVPGSHEFKVFSSSGELVTRTITVVQQRHARIENISAPGKFPVGQAVSINITLAAISAFSGIIKTVIDDYTDTHPVSLGAAQSKTLEMEYVPQSPGKKSASITLLSDSQQYEDGWDGSFQVENQKQWWDYFFEWLQGIVDSVVRAFSGG